jgi:hypothetical protein
MRPRTEAAIGAGRTLYTQMHASDDPAVPTKPDWKVYEHQIYELLQAKAKDAQVTFDDQGRQTLPGRFSEIDRQIDVIVRGKFPPLGEELVLIVDCKCFSRRIDVGDMEAFVGLVEDVGALLGLLVTNVGFSEAAKRRGNAVRGISIDVAEFDRLALWKARVPTISHTAGTNTVVLAYTDPETGRTDIESVSLRAAHELLETWGRDTSWLPGPDE